MMKRKKHWMLAAILFGSLMITSCSSGCKECKAVSETDDTSQFVTITDVVPDVILEIRYYGT